MNRLFIKLSLLKRANRKILTIMMRKGSGRILKPSYRRKSLFLTSLEDSLPVYPNKTNRRIGLCLKLRSRNERIERSQVRLTHEGRKKAKNAEKWTFGRVLKMVLLYRSRIGWNACHVCKGMVSMAENKQTAEVFHEWAKAVNIIF